MDKIYDIYDKIETIAPHKVVFLTQTEPFQLLIAVILSAQTTDENVNKVCIHLFKKYPNAKALSEANQKDVEKIIHSTGFYKMKAKNIIACSKALIYEYDGIIPNSIEKLVKLNGVGRKTANVIMGHVYNKGAIIVDTHFKRMCLRLGLTTTDDPTKIELEIKKRLVVEKQYRFSMTLNWFGRTHCKSRKPMCENCILTNLCVYNSNK